MKTLLHFRDRSSKGAALMIVLAFVVLLTGLALAYFSRAGTDRQLAQSSFNDTNADLLARSALDITVSDFKQEILAHPTVTPNPPNCYSTPVPYTPAPQIAGPPIANLIRQSFSGDPTGRTSSVNSGAASANGRSISTARWNSHYLIPRGNTSNTTIDPSPTPSFTAPDWVLLTAQGPNPAPAPSAVIGRYAFAVYDEGGLLDMSLAGYPSWSGQPDAGCNPNPSATPWLVNVGRKGTVALADLTGLGTYAPPQTQIDNIVGWRNYATTLRTGATFSNFNYAPETSCTIQDNYGSYLLDFGDPPFTFDITNQPVPISVYPFTCIFPMTSGSRTDQALMTRQELLRLRTAICTDPVTGNYDDTKFPQNALQYMGTFSRERNKPAPDWPYLQGNLSEGRFCFDNLDLVKPNPDNCNYHGHGKGQGKSRGRGHLCGTQADIVNLFGLLWIHSDLTATPPRPGYWRYIAHNGPTHDPNPNAIDHIPPFRGPNHQNDFFQILDYALFRINYGITGDADPNHRSKAFAIGASLIDQYDSGADCPGIGCDVDTTLTGNNKKYLTHTTVIDYNGSTLAYGMEPNFSSDSVNGDDPYDPNPTGSHPHRPSGAPNPNANAQVVSRGFTTVGEFGYGIDTSPSGVAAGLPTLKFWDSSTTPPFQYAPVLDFFSYDPVSSAYPRAGIVNLYTRNAPVIAAMLKSALKNDTTTTPPSSVVSQTEALNAANAIVTETQRVLAGTASPAVTQTDLTRAVVGRLAAAAFNAVPSLATSDDTKGAVVRALAEMGQTRTWNLFIDVIAQTGRYAPGTTSITQADKFTVEGEKRYWLHIALGRDLVSGSVDVLGTQLEEVTQ
jgi:hypothetical protein